MHGTPQISIVTTLYCSSNYIDEFYERVVSTARQLHETFELIFVNDGSPDDSLEVAKKYLKGGEAVKIVNLSRNFGHHKAMMTGLRHASGQQVFLIDSDLEESPELLKDFYMEVKQDSDIDVVYGVQRVRPGSFSKRWLGSLFYKVFNFFADVPIPENLSVVRLMSRRYVDALLEHGETEVMIGGLWARTGFLQKPIPIDKKFKGTTTYTFLRQLSLMTNSIVSSSTKPLAYLFWVGFITSIFSMLYIFVIIVQKFFWGISVPGFTSIFVSVWLLGGLILAALGLLGIYLGVVFREVKQRPMTVVKNIYTSSSATRSSSVNNDV